jgi:hypothetical protein
LSYLCVGGIIFISWFSKELKNNLSKNNWLRGVILILLVCESIFVGWRFPFPIVLVFRYKLFLCHTLSNRIYLAFQELLSLCVGYVITSFVSFGIRAKRLNSTQLIKNNVGRRQSDRNWFETRSDPKQRQHRQDQTRNKDNTKKN